MKKVLAIVISLILVLSVSVPLSGLLSFAEDTAPVSFYSCDSLTEAELYGSAVSVTGLGTHNSAGDCLITDLSGRNSQELGIILSSAVNASGAVYLEFDYYISSTDLTAGIIDSQIEISCDRNNDTAEIHWNAAALNSQNLTAGWNHVKLPIASKSGADGVFSDSSVLRFRQYILFDRTVSGSIGYDNIQLTFEAQSGAGSDNTNQSSIVWTDCDEGGNGWWFNPDRNEGLSFENRAGEKDAVVNTVNGTAVSAAYRNTDGLDISDMEYMEFDLYVSRADLFSGAVGDAQLELTSTDWVDNYEIHYNKASLAAIPLTEGWNHVKLPLSDFVSGSTTVFDAESLKFMRIYVVYLNSPVELTVKFDNLCFTKEITAPPASAESVDWSGKNGWWFDPNALTDLSRDTYKTENDAVVMAASGNNLVAAYRSDTTDISAMEYMEFDIYLSDASLIAAATGGELELTSSSWRDSKEINLSLNDLKAINWQNGWNHIKIALSDFTAFDGQFDSTALNFLHFYLSFDSSAERSVKLSNLIFTKAPDDDTDQGGEGDGGDGGGETTPDNPPEDTPPTDTDGVNWSGKNGWWFEPEALTDLSRDNYKTENDAVIMAASGNSLVAAYRSDAVDISKMGYMEFDLYLSDTSVISSASSGELELTSSNWCDSKEINLSLNDLKAINWQSGWNHVKVTLSDFNAFDGLFDSSALNFMRFFLIYEEVAERTVKISNVIFTKSEYSSADEEVRDTTAGYITGCDSRVGWLTNSGTKISLDTEDKKQGAASLKFASVGNNGVELRYTFDPMNLSDAQYLSFDFYISDASVLNNATDMQVELSSSGMPDVNELNWNLSFIKGLELKNGWNSISLPLMWGRSTGGGIDLSKVCYFRLYCVFGGEKEFVWKIDGLKTEKAAADGKTFLSLDCDTVSGWQVGENITVTRDTGNKKQGSASVRFNAAAEGIALSAAFSGVNVAGANAIQFYLHLPDTNVLETATDMQFEITSSGEPDKNELHWGKDIIVSRVTEDGWNLVTLLFEEGEESEDKIDLGKLDFLRFYIVNGKSTEYAINLDDIKILKIDDTEAVKNANKPATKPVDGVLTLSECDSLIGWSTGDKAVMTLDKQNKVSGKASVSIESQGGILYRYVFDSLDVSFANYLEFDLYVPTLSVFNATDMQVELSSNTDDDDAEINWNREDFLALDLKQGWNHIRLYFGDADKSSSLGNDFDPAKLCFYRFYIASQEPTALKLDNLCVSALDEPAVYTEVTAGELKEKAASTQKPVGNDTATDKEFSVLWIVIPVVVVLVALAAIAVILIIRRKKA